MSFFTPSRLHAILVTVGTAVVQAGYMYVTSAGSVFSVKLLVTSLLTGLMSGIFGYMLSEIKSLDAKPATPPSA